MSDLFEKKLFLSPAARRHGGKAGFALGRILSVIFFVIALGMFFGGLFFWLQKRQASLDSGAAARICATPEMLSGELKAALKDRVDYSFWPPYHISPMEKQDLLRNCLAEAQKYLSAADVVQKSSFVWKSLQSLPLMVRHYAMSPPEAIVSRPKGPKSFAVFEVEGHPCAQLLVGFEKTPDMEFCFFKDEQDGSWKLDWQQFARFQPMNWEDFVRGKGEDIAEFRVWMVRERMSENKDDYAFKLIAPGMNGSEERSIARPMVYVPRKSEMGKRLFMLFKINEEMEHSPYRVLNANDEADMLRARFFFPAAKSPTARGNIPLRWSGCWGKAGTAFLSRNKKEGLGRPLALRGMGMRFTGDGNGEGALHVGAWGGGAGKGAGMA